MNRLVELVLIAWAAVAVAHTTITPPQHHRWGTCGFGRNTRIYMEPIND